MGSSGSFELRNPEPRTHYPEPIAFQNLALNASCTCRSVVPHNAHDGLASIAEIVPNAAFPNWPFGFANCGWLKMLNASMRNSVVTCPIGVVLIIDRSTLN